MAPVTRSSLHGRSISREGSWQDSTAEDLPLGEPVHEREVAGHAEDETAGEDRPDEASDDDPFHDHQGMSVRATGTEQPILTTA